MTGALLLAGTALLTRDGARAAARRELSRLGYHGPSLADRLLADAARLVLRLLELAAAHAPGGPLGLFGLAALAVAVVAALRIGVGPIRPGSRVGRIGTLTPPATAATYRAAAERSRAEGRYAEALRQRFRAIGRELEEHGELSARPGRTARELAVAAGVRLPPVAGDLAAGAQVFDAVCYGGRPATAGDDDRLARLDLAVRAALVDRSPAAHPVSR